MLDFTNFPELRPGYTPPKVPATIWGDLPKPPFAIAPSGWLSRLWGVGPQALVTGLLWASPLNPSETLPAYGLTPSGDFWQPDLLPSHEVTSSPSRVVHEIEPRFAAAPGFMTVQPMSDPAPDTRWDVPAPVKLRDPMSAIEVPEKLMRSVSTAIEFSQAKPSGPVRITVRPRLRREEWRPRVNESKGSSYYTYVGAQRLFTATFGAATEMQDFVEAVAWNAFDKNGLPAMLAVKRESFAGEVIAKGDVLGAARVNARAYSSIYAGLASGRFSLDVGGALVDYGAGQASDAAIAYQGRLVQSAFNSTGYRLPVGVEALANMQKRQIGVPTHGENSVFSLLNPWSSALRGRLRWSRSRGLSFS